MSHSCDSMDCRLPGSSVHGIFQARLLELLFPSPGHLPDLSVKYYQINWMLLKYMPANVRDIRDWGSIPGLGISLGRGHGNPLQYSCLGNPMDRGAWRVTVHSVAESEVAKTRLERLSTHALRQGLSNVSC